MQGKKSKGITNNRAMIKQTYKPYSFFILKIRKIADRILKILSFSLVSDYYNKLNCIAGKLIIVEIDESKFRKHKYNGGYYVGVSSLISWKNRKAKDYVNSVRKQIKISNKR